jgi:hypothetical protein
MKRECTICKHYGEETDTSKEIEKSIIYDESSTPYAVTLCRKHSVELFKLGQRRFMLEHYRILTDLISSDEMKFIEILQKTVQANLDEIM